MPGDITEFKGNYIEENKGTINQTINLLNQPFSIPSNIPSPKGFIGRKVELTALRQAKINGNTTFVIHGIAGVGKTALALAFSNEIKDEYQARILVDMNGLSDKPLSARDAMLEIVKEFDPTISQNLHENLLKKNFVSKIQNQPTLIVLDNVKDKNSVNSLINDVDACFIITSRQRIYLGEETFEILKMSEKDAVDLLKAKGGEQRFGASAGEFARECGYLPIALKVIKSLLMTRRLLIVDDFLEKFRAEKLQHLDEVAASFNLSYKLISEKLRTHWVQLAVFPADFDAYACATVWKIDIASTNETIDELDSFSLFEVNTESRRFNLHDLTREFCRKKIIADPQLLSESLNLFVFHYSNLVKNVMATEMANNPTNRLLAYARCAVLEEGNLFEAKRIISSRVISQSEIQNLSKDALEALVNLHTPFLDFYYLLGEFNILGGLNSGLGAACMELGYYDQAERYLLNALENIESCPNKKTEARATFNLASLSLLSQDPNLAIERAKKAMDLYSNFGDKIGSAKCRKVLGLAYTGIGELHIGLRYCERAVKLFNRISNCEREEGRSWMLSGLIYFLLKNKQKSTKSFDRAILIFRNTNNGNEVKFCLKLKLLLNSIINPETIPNSVLLQLLGKL